MPAWLKACAEPKAATNSAAIHPNPPQRDHALSDGPCTIGDAEPLRVLSDRDLATPRALSSVLDVRDAVADVLDKHYAGGLSTATTPGSTKRRRTAGRKSKPVSCPWS